MNIYVVGFYDYELTVEHILYHEKKFTPKQFKKICDKAMNRLVYSALKDETGWIGYGSFEQELPSILVKECGFMKPEIVNAPYSGSGIYCFSCGKIKDDYDIKWATPKNKRLIIEHNKKVSKTLM